MAAKFSPGAANVPPRNISAEPPAHLPIIRSLVLSHNRIAQEVAVKRMLSAVVPLALVLALVAAPHQPSAAAQHDVVVYTLGNGATSVDVVPIATAQAAQTDPEQITVYVTRTGA